MHNIVNGELSSRFNGRDDLEAEKWNKNKNKEAKKKRIAGIYAPELWAEGKNRYNRILKRLNQIMVHSGLLILLVSNGKWNEKANISKGENLSVCANNEQS